MPGINSILDIGRWGLFASQSALQVTGSNIANVNTAGYSRREVRLEEGYSIDYTPGQVGTGVRATEVFRHFDNFIEEQYNAKSALQFRWDALYQNLRTVDSLFNESITGGINASLAQFWEDWQDLSLRPEDISTREALLGNTQNMLNTIHTASSDMQRFQEQMDDFIGQEVDNANAIIQEIADINRQINAHEVPGQNNANALLDRRATLVRDLSEIVDLNVIDNGSGNYAVQTKAGHTLVDGVETYELKLEGAKTFTELTNSSNFDGQIYYEGSDDFEYTFEVVSAGLASNGGSAAQLRVSIDGGSSWLKDDDGNEMHIAARGEDMKIAVGDLSVWFGTDSDSNTLPLQQMEAGDTFTIVPKSGLYWYQNTSDAVNITSQIRLNGTDNERRITGGKLAGYFNFRDYHIGRYREKLDAMAGSLIWEVNRAHSQGMGLQKFSDITGTYSVELPDQALASNSTALAFGNKLQSGSTMLYIYDSASGELASGASFGALDFSGVVPPGIATFDPDRHSLEDVRDAVNDTFGNFVTADIVNNRLHLRSDSGYEFAFGTDTAGLSAALGMNTFFTGDDGGTIELNPEVKNDLDFIAAGHVNGGGEVNQGDNTTAVKIAELQHETVSIRTFYEASTSLTISEYYNTITAGVGADTSGAEFNKDYFLSLTDDLNNRQEEISGVNLDEEMGNLIRFQHSYTAAAKLIQTADQMLQTVLGLKN